MDKRFVELVENISKSALAIHDVWGCTSDQYGRYIKTYTTTLEIKVRSGRFSIRGNDISVDTGWGYSRPVEDFNTLIDIESELSSMALYFASEDWLSHVEHSVKRLKAITRALSV